MSMTFKVDGAEVRKNKTGKDYLAVKIVDKTVLFFDAPDVTMPVKAGDAITCDLKQSGRFWNGKSLRVVDARSAKVTPLPAELGASAAPAAATTTASGSSQGSVENQTVRAGSRTYFIDVKVDQADQKYMTIKESAGAGRECFRIMLLADHVDEFADAVEKARTSMK